MVSRTAERFDSCQLPDTLRAMDINELNQRFAIPDHCRVVAGSGGLACVEVANAAARSEIYLLGAHVATWQPTGADPVLWVSETSQFKAGWPIRGGIPVCWPWFATEGPSEAAPLHGPVRLVEWELSATEALADATRVVLRCDQARGAGGWFDHGFELELVVTVGAELDVALHIHNTGSDAFSWSGALHSYLAVADVNATTISGLSGVTYLDKCDNFAPKIQDGPMEFVGTTDRIYQDTESPVEIHDTGRIIRIAKRGSHSTVIWNPGAVGAAGIGDITDDGWRGFCCVESANAERYRQELAAGARAELATTLSLA